MVGNVRVGMRVTDIAASTTSLRYFHTDHLGSVAVITNEAAVVVERLSYDAWGKRRYPNGADDPSGAITSQTSRGFTGHEELDSVALVHMNGRLYDALMGRMISADPTVPDPMNAQAWNRYSYVGNDPLAFTDPSGFSWLSNFFSGAGNFFGKIFSPAILRSIAQLVITTVLTPIIGPVLAAAAGAAIITGLSGGNLGQMLRAAAIAAWTAGAFYGVGEMTNALANYTPVGDMPAHFQPAFGTEIHAFNVAGHALVGCASSVASGGSCQSGALAGAVSAAGAPLMGRLNGTERLVASAVLGGVGSVAGGGKFANGAIMGAFGYLFNKCGGLCFVRAAFAVDRMFRNWVTGLGPSELYFGQDSDQVHDMEDAPGVQDARNRFWAKNAGGGPLQDYTDHSARFGASGYQAAGTSPTQQFVGSYRVDINVVASEDADYLQFTLTNTTSMTSFLAGLGPNWNRSAFFPTPFGNMKQTYQWIEQAK